MAGAWARSLMSWALRQFDNSLRLLSEGSRASQLNDVILPKGGISDSAHD